MTKRKKKKDTMSNVALSGIVTSTVVGSVPSSLAPGASGLRTGFSTGVGKVGSKLPAVGKLKGAGMVLKATKKLKKKYKNRYRRNYKRKLKGGIE